MLSQKDLKESLNVNLMTIISYNKIVEKKKFLKYLLVSLFVVLMISFEKNVSRGLIA
jgi:hypothetical protein